MGSHETSTTAISTINITVVDEDEHKTKEAIGALEATETKDEIRKATSREKTGLANQSGGEGDSKLQKITHSPSQRARPSGEESVQKKTAATRSGSAIGLSNGDHETPGSESTQQEEHTHNLNRQSSRITEAIQAIQAQLEGILHGFQKAQDTSKPSAPHEVSQDSNQKGSAVPATLETTSSTLDYTERSGATTSWTTSNSKETRKKQSMEHASQIWSRMGF